MYRSLIICRRSGHNHRGGIAWARLSFVPEDSFTSLAMLGHVSSYAAGLTTCPMLGHVSSYAADLTTCHFYVGSRVTLRCRLDHVVMYDMPQDVGEYVHCAGRTARRGNEGVVTCASLPTLGLETSISFFDCSPGMYV